MEHGLDDHETAIASETARPRDGSRKLIYGLAGALVVVILAMYAWKQSAVSGLEAQLAQAEARLTEARAQLIGEAKKIDADKTVESLRLFSRPFGWSIRREMLAKNLDQVDQYFSELVQIPNFQAATLALPDGNVAVASDRKRLGVAFTELYPQGYLQADGVLVEPDGAGNLRAVIPVLGLNQRLGTVVLEYQPTAYPLQ